jgi:hypothetical protein
MWSSSRPDGQRFTLMSRIRNAADLEDCGRASHRSRGADRLWQV